MVYRRYASLYVLAGVDADENPLAALELVHSYVEALDKFFGAVCELDIMFHLEKAHYILDEMVMNGACVRCSGWSNPCPCRCIAFSHPWSVVRPVLVFPNTGCIVETNRAKILQPVAALEVVKPN